MRALILNCTLKRSPAPSRTQELADVVGAELARRGVEVESVRVADLRIEPGVETDMGDDWTAVHDKLLASEILVIASPTWFGSLSSVAKRVLERMAAMLSETDDENRPVAANRVAGVVVADEDDARHVINEVGGVLHGIGYTIPGQAWTYGTTYGTTGPDHSGAGHGHGWSATTSAAMAANLVAVATALAKQPIPA